MRNKMKKIIFTLLLLVSSVAVNAASFSLDNKKVKGEERPSAAVYKNIIATGYGLNEEQARANAFKSAVEQYVGVVVDSQAQMENGDLISDSILTASNGFIKEYKDIYSKKNEGMFEVKINAVVESQKLIEKIKSLNIAVMEVKGAKNIQARVETRQIAKADAEKMLKKVILPLYSSDSIREMISVKVDGVVINEKMVKDKKIPVTLKYTLSVDYSVYKNRVAVLEQLFKNLGGRVYEKIDFPYIRHFGVSSSFVVKNVEKIRSLNKKPTFGIVKKNGAGYKLDVWEFPEQWMGIYPFTLKSSGMERDDLFRLIDVVAEILGDEVLLSDNIDPTGNSFVFRANVSGGGYIYGWNIYRRSGMPAIVPTIFGNGGYGESVSYSHDFMMPLKLVGEIKSVNVEIH